MKLSVLDKVNDPEGTDIEKRLAGYGSAGTPVVDDNKGSGGIGSGGIGSGGIFDNINSSRYLYDSNLQNIFDDYQENIATLDKKKQTALQDAYHIREMSKKYLGEYASNVGVGDVSGNLIDIYGSYQKNLAAIEEHYGDLSMNLQQTFQKNRMEALNQILIKEKDFRLEEKSEQSRKVFTNLANGDFGEFDNFSDYLKDEYTNNGLGFEEYQSFLSMMQEDKANEIYSEAILGRIPEEFENVEQWIASEVANKTFGQTQGNEILLKTQDYYRQMLANDLAVGAETGVFGVKQKLDENGNPIEGEYEFDYDGLSIFEKYKKFIPQNEYNESVKLREVAIEERKKLEKEWEDAQAKQLKGTVYGATYDPSGLVKAQDIPYVDSNSEIFSLSFGGIERHFAVSNALLEHDEIKPRDVDNEELDFAYSEAIGHEVANGAAFHYKGTFYYHKDGNWRRAIEMSMTGDLSDDNKKLFLSLDGGLKIAANGEEKIDGFTVKNTYDSKTKENSFTVSYEDEEGKKITEKYDVGQFHKTKDLKIQMLKDAAEYAKYVAKENKYSLKKSSFIFYYQGNYFQFKKNTIAILFKEQSKK